MGDSEWDLAPQGAFRVTSRVRGLQNAPRGIHFCPRLNGELDFEPQRLSAGGAFQYRSRPSKVCNDLRPRVLQRNF